MSNLEMVFFWLSLVIYSLASGGFLYSFIFKNPRFMPKMTALILIGFMTHTIAICARYQAQGHLPWSGDYESAMMGGWFIIAGTLYVGWRNKSLQALATASVPLVVIMMGFGVMRNPVLTPMSAALKNYWLYIHVYFAWLAFGAYVLAMAAGVLYLMKRKSVESGVVNPSYEKYPSLDRLDELIFRYVLFGFIADTIMLAAGAIWANDLWGRYWSWDPVETWALVSWLMYGMIIHLRITFGWRESRIAWLAILALSTVIISFFGVTFVVDTSLHTFQVR
jgi:cytochrome c-type biogenesis protein CcsB